MATNQRGFAEIKAIEHIVDLDAAPFVPEGWIVESHKRGGKAKLELRSDDPLELRGDDLYINDRKVELYLSKQQMGRKAIKGHSLRNEVSKEDVLNANALDYLLAHSNLIPKSWVGKYVFFWGIIYGDPDGDLCVRCLDPNGGWYHRLLDDDFDVNFPAAVAAK